MVRKVVLIFYFLFSCELYSQDIFDAARKGDVERIKSLLKIKPDTINSRNESDFTPLIIAGYRNQLEAVEFLLKNGADVNANSPEGTALIAAAYKGNVPLGKILIRYHANINAQNDDGISALMYAVMGNHLELVKFLLANGASKILESKSGHTALSYANIYGYKDLTFLLSN